MVIGDELFSDTHKDDFSRGPKFSDDELLRKSLSSQKGAECRFQHPIPTNMCGAQYVETFERWNRVDDKEKEEMKEEQNKEDTDDVQSFTSDEEWDYDLSSTKDARIDDSRCTVSLSSRTDEDTLLIDVLVDIIVDMITEQPDNMPKSVGECDGQDIDDAVAEVQALSKPIEHADKESQRGRKRKADSDSSLRRISSLEDNHMILQSIVSSKSDVRPEP